MTIILDTPEAINAYRLLALKGALKLEIAGMQFKGGRLSAYRTIKEEFGFKGNKQSVYDQYVAYLTEIGVLK